MTIIYVPTVGTPTISSAIAIASPGDTIQVAAGTYAEHVQINVANLTLLGAQANVDARTRPFVPANESIITFPTPAFGTGIVNLEAPNIIFNGFTVQGNIANSTSAIFAGDAGLFLPNTTTLDVTGLQILNSIIQNNANGILIASIEPSPKATNYLVSQCYFYNNSGDPGSGDGQGVFFNNSAGLLMTNIVVQNNLFNGLETSTSVNLTYISGAVVINNVMNQDNSIGLFGTNNTTVSNNILYQSTGVTPLYPTNTASAFYITNTGVGPSTIYNTNLVISDNLIYEASSNGMTLSGASNVADAIIITGNCIIANTRAGIHFAGPVSSGVTINNNNIGQNHPGLLLDANSYTIPPLLDATNNYWNSPSGPNYNGGGPGTGDAITDNNIPVTVSVSYTPYLTAAGVCPFSSAVTLTKTTPSINVSPYSTIYFTVTLTVTSVPATVTSFLDALPPLSVSQSWLISSQSPANFFVINGYPGSQTLSLTSSLPAVLAPGVYTVTIYAVTNCRDAGRFFPNTAAAIVQLNGISGFTQNLSATAIASVALNNRSNCCCYQAPNCCSDRRQNCCEYRRC